MFSLEAWKEIYSTLRKNKLRTFLTGFTMALGIFIVVILVGLTNGLKNTFDKFFGNNPTNVIYFFPGRTSIPFKGYESNRRIEFENSDIADIEENFASFLSAISPRISRGNLVRYKQESNNYTTQGVAPSHRIVEQTIMMKGRFINDKDLKDRTKVCVIGRMVVKDLYGDEDPIGTYLDIGGIAFQVVGVFQDDDGDNAERIIYVPYKTIQRIEKSTDKVDFLIILFKPGISAQIATAFQNNVLNFLRDKKFINPDDTRAIFVRNIASDYERNQQFAGALGMIALSFAIGTIIAGIVAIGNIMVFVVKERTREIGIRKAVGARPRDIIGIILLEASVITIIFGFIGMGIGVLILENMGDVLSDYFIEDPYVSGRFAISATVLLIVCGILAGMIPARRAARIQPVEAMRSE